MNENGQRLLEFCTYHALCVTNSYFQTKPQHKVSWRHPHSKQTNSRQNTVSTSALDAIECLPTMDELDTEPTLVELGKAIDSLTAGKVPDSDGNNTRPDQSLQDCPIAPIARSPLSVLARRCCSKGYEGRQDHHHLQEQGWAKRLQQLQGHLAPQHSWQSLHTYHLSSPTKNSRTCSSRVPVWVPRQEINGRHDFLPSPASEKMQGIERAPGPCFHRSYQGIWSGQ